MRAKIFTLFVACCLQAQLVAGPARILVYQKNGKGFVHDNVAASAAAIVELGARHGFEVDVSTNASVFSDRGLSRYQALVFANSNNEAFENDAQKAAFQKFIERGGGFVGIHSSTGSERSWEFFQQTQGAKFLRHAPMQQFTARVVVTNEITAHLGERWVRTDECYFFTNLNPQMRVLLAAEVTKLKDPKLKSDPGGMIDGVFPLAWQLQSHGGRQFYTSLGHKIEHYADPVFRQHIANGILWVLGKTNAAPGQSPRQTLTHAN